LILEVTYYVSGGTNPYSLTRSRSAPGGRQLRGKLQT